MTEAPVKAFAATHMDMINNKFIPRPALRRFSHQGFPEAILRRGFRRALVFS
ncbi:hypothetical protein [Rhizobium sp. AG855]|uniref:hypothetical protein n=1 Tax=Rhizobium sp. AG855 TaxID=2183898 RepID=UPI000FF19818|nr:hypothetical protein [Rhizobium sp. AG855]RKE85458.1 hypothetical protein DFO46_2256 [Rhizobium sp. AG855]